MKKNIQYTRQYGVRQEDATFSIYPIIDDRMNMEIIPGYLFRTVRDDETCEGIFCTNPLQNIEPKNHVHGGYKNSQWISTTASFITACAWAQKEQKRIAVINTAVFDLANCQNLRSGKGMKGQAQNWAKSSQEVLFLREIPACAIKKVISLEEVNELMEWGGDFTSFNTRYEYEHKAKITAKRELKSTAGSIETLAQRASTWEESFLGSNLFCYSRKFWNMEACAHLVVKSK